ncbi:hypothetical protein ABW19_dt0206388 [Dactylella cylindrospora]|nr:hypothetical protein ABW19_dt0206388 [Dactylella cylindrospora]
MHIKQILFATLASVAIVNAVAVPKPQDLTPGFPCGCTNDCIIACAGKPDCFCPQYCDPKYECPSPTTTTPSVTTPIRPTITCGCLNDCIVGCPDLRLCKCADYCDPKYECPTTTAKPTTTVKPTKTTTSVKPTFTCGCTNDCFVNCPPGENCICPLFCDPKYACPTTTPPTKTTTSVKPTFTCGCLNDCIVNCTAPPCACPKNCDPKYACPTITTRTKPTLVPYSLPTPITTGVPCGCHNDCTINCGKKTGCACPAYCDPKYMCTV